MRSLLEILHDTATWGLRAAVPVAAWGMWREWRASVHDVASESADHVGVAMRRVRGRVAGVRRSAGRVGWRTVTRVRAYLAGSPGVRRARHLATGTAWGGYRVRGGHRSGGVTVRQVRVAAVGEAVRVLADQRSATVASLRWARKVVLA